MTQKTSHPTTHAKEARPPKHVENSTDATRGEPLALRAQKRRLELEQALAKIPLEDSRARSDIELAMASLDAMLTGDLEHLSEPTASDLARLLENSKHLAETVPKSRNRA